MVSQGIKGLACLASHLFDESGLVLDLPVPESFHDRFRFFVYLFVQQAPGLGSPQIIAGSEHMLASVLGRSDPAFLKAIGALGARRPLEVFNHGRCHFPKTMTFDMLLTGISFSKKFLSARRSDRV